MVERAILKSDTHPHKELSFEIRANRVYESIGPYWKLYSFFFCFQAFKLN